MWFGICLFKISIWYTNWYMFGICSVYKYDQKLWPWLKISAQIIFNLVFVQYTNTELVYGPLKGFIVIPPLCSMPEQREVTIFDWFMLFMCLIGLCILTFFCCVQMQRSWLETILIPYYPYCLGKRNSLLR